MAVILHVITSDHHCKCPAGWTTPASYIKAGDMLSLGEWHLAYNPHVKAYQVFTVRDVEHNDYYQFNNLTCAKAKLAALGNYEA